MYGITRRGFGASGFVAGEYGADLLGGDVLAVIDALKLSKPILVGHSFAGEELSTVANRRPHRIAGVVYLEAAYPYAFDNGKGMSMVEFQQIVREPQSPPPLRRIWAASALSRVIFCVCAGSAGRKRSFARSGR